MINYYTTSLSNFQSAVYEALRNPSNNTLINDRDAKLKKFREYAGALIKRIDENLSPEDKQSLTAYKNFLDNYPENPSAGMPQLNYYHESMMGILKKYHFDPLVLTKEKLLPIEKK
jgi:hypothetical protein